MSSVLTLVINLDDSEDRLANVRASLQSERMEFERISGVDARGKSPASFSQYDDDKAKRFFGHGLTGGEVGCYLSHLRAIERFLQSDAEFGLVLEDDVDIPQGVAGQLDQLFAWLSAHPDLAWAVINLGKKPKHTTKNLAEFDRFALFRAFYYPTTTTAILWSRSGAESFRDAHGKIIAPVDHVLRHWAARNGQGLALSPALLVPTGAESVIDASGPAGGAKRKSVRKPPQFLWREFLRQGGNYVHAIRHYLADRT